MTSPFSLIAVFFSLLALTTLAAVGIARLRSSATRLSAAPSRSVVLPTISAESSRRLVAISAERVPVEVVVRAAERHALHVGALRVPGLSVRQFEPSTRLPSAPMVLVARRPGLSRTSTRIGRRLAVVR